VIRVFPSILRFFFFRCIAFHPIELSFDRVVFRLFFVDGVLILIFSSAVPLLILHYVASGSIDPHFFFFGLAGVPGSRTFPRSRPCPRLIPALVLFARLIVSVSSVCVPHGPSRLSTRPDHLCSTPAERPPFPCAYFPEVFDQRCHSFVQRRPVRLFVMTRIFQLRGGASPQIDSIPVP